LRGEARSPTCGSSIVLGLNCDPGGIITRVGLRAQACAIGQAAAAIFANGASGTGRKSIAATLEGLSQWLASNAAPPDWPGLTAIESACAYPARHGAILLPWRAALVALPPT
jgi:NifU-like protein involved in Fe-S cluster formation